MGPRSMGRGRQRWVASERVAFRILEERGYRILETHRRVVIDGVEVAEVDAVAEGSDGEIYAVEVKAGRLDVNGVRQAYVNALVLNAKPLVVCKGYADEAAEKLAEKLGVEVLALEDVFLVDAEELESLVYGAVVDASAEVLRILLDPSIRVPRDYFTALKALASSPTLLDAAKKLNTSVKELKPVLEYLRSTTQLARRGWQGVRLAAALLSMRLRLEALLDRLESSAERLDNIIP